MWFLWFSFGFFVGLFSRILIDYAQENLSDLLIYISRINGPGRSQTFIRSHATKRSSDLSQSPKTRQWSQSPKTRQRITGNQIASSIGSSETSQISSDTPTFTGEISTLLQTPNVAFYENRIPAEPNDEYIEDILLKWVGNYEKLQNNFAYIQWLFPNRMPRTNEEAHVLTSEEAVIIRQTPELRNRVKRAFKMMLDFYGMRLTKNNRIQLSENSNERLKQLNQEDNINFLRITRILLALKDLGHNNLMLPWMKCLEKLIYKENALSHAKFSFENYWINTLDTIDKLVIVMHNTVSAPF